MQVKTQLPAEIQTETKIEVEAIEPIEAVIPENKKERNDTPTDENHILVSINGTWKTIPLNNRKKLLFYDMLNYVDIDLEKPQGNIIIKLNGKDATYTATISQGDSIEVAWDKPEI